MSNGAENALKHNSDTLTHCPRHMPFSSSLRTQRAIDMPRDSVTHRSGTASYMAEHRIPRDSKKHKGINYICI